VNYYYLLGLVGAYLYGAMPFGYLIALSKGVDIRKLGLGTSVPQMFTEHSA